MAHEPGRPEGPGARQPRLEATRFIVCAELNRFDLAMSSESPVSSSSSEPAPQPLSPAARKRIQQYFEFGRQKAKQGDRAYAHSMFAQCVAGDPSNLVYVDALLENLKARHEPNRRKARVSASRSPFKKAHSESRWPDVIALGLELLEENPWDIPTLRGMADACAALHYNEVELRYLKNALDSNPKDIEVNRHCAHSLTRMGQFDQAIACWHRVEELLPGKSEASRMISQLTMEKNRAAAGYGDDKAQATGARAATSSTPPSASTVTAGNAPLTRPALEQALLKDPSVVKNYLALAELFDGEGNLTEMEQVLRRAVQVSGNDMAIRERLENVQLRLARRQIEIAEQRAQDDPSDAARQLVQQLRQDANRLELSVFQNRAHRYPGDARLKHELALRLKRAGLFSEAIKNFEAAAVLPTVAADAALQSGECQQQLRQYQVALQAYQKADELARAAGQADVAKQALYRAGILAAALKNHTLARACFISLLNQDPAYRDAQARLDKLASIQDIQGSPQG